MLPTEVVVEAGELVGGSVVLAIVELCQIRRRRMEGRALTYHCGDFLGWVARIAGTSEMTE